MKNKFDLIIYDFDGVMTDNKVYLSETGAETVLCNRSDGLAVSMISSMGYKQIIISTEKNNIVQLRAKKLNIVAFNNISNKSQILSKIVSEGNYDFNKTVYIGNDLNDFDAMKLCGFRLCPSDSCDEIKELSNYELPVKGGDGVIRYFLKHFF